MINMLKNMVSSAFYAPVARNMEQNGALQAQKGIQNIAQTQITSGVQSLQKISPVSTGLETGNNPFLNPFVHQTSNSNYGINKPVKGGYFAGYYNGKPNIVGRRLFLEA